MDPAPLPWRAEHNFAFGSGILNVRSGILDADDNVHSFVRGESSISRAAIAERIVRSVNCHDALIAACRSVLMATGGSDHWNGVTNEALLLAESALEAAGENVPEIIADALSKETT